MKCKECEREVDASKPGHGHRFEPVCGQYMFDVPPEVIGFLKEQPEDATPEQLLKGWMARLIPELKDARHDK
jgi:hypothetical protein